VLAALAAAEGNISRAAKRLGVHRNTLARVMKKYGIEKDDTKP
jgi:transcriptional regulator of acetoin/glycerol metabolism